MSFRPLNDRVVIRGVEPESKTAGGIHIPDAARDKPTEGDVIAVGPGTRAADGRVHPLDVEVGDRVLFGRWAGTAVKLDGEDIVIMNEADILGIVTRAAAASRQNAKKRDRSK